MSGGFEISPIPPACTRKASGHFRSVRFAQSPQLQLEQEMVLSPHRLGCTRYQPMRLYAVCNGSKTKLATGSKRRNMGDLEDLRRIRLHFETEDRFDHVVPADALAAALKGLQGIIYTFAMRDGDNWPVRRGRVLSDIKRRFALSCRIPEAGSYAMPVEFGSSPHGLLETEEIGRVGREFQQVSRAMTDGDTDALRRHVPHEDVRKRLITQYEKIQPPKRSGIVLSIEDHKRDKLVDGSRIRDSINRMKVPRLGQDRRVVPATTPATVVGTLVSMNFETRSLRLKLLDGTSLDARYSKDFEPHLLEHRRGLMHFRGEPDYDGRDSIVALNRVDMILPIDESPMQLDGFAVDNKRYLAVPPLRFSVKFDHKDGLYDLEGDFDIRLCADDRSLLEESVKEELAMLWTEYAQEQPALLSPKAQRLRGDLLKRFQEVRS